MPRTRLLIVLLCVGLLLQLLSGLAMHHSGPGWTQESLLLHYGHHEALAVPESDTEDLDMLTPPPPPPETEIMASAIMETAHIHLAIMPFVVFLVTHLFAMTTFGRTRTAAVLSYVTFVAALLDCVVPFAIRLWGGPWVSLKLVAFICMVAGLLVMLLWVLGAIAVSLKTAGPAQGAKGST